MKTKSIPVLSIITLSVIIFGGTMILGAVPGWSAETLKLSCSAQVFEAFNDEGISAFTDKTGIEVQVEIGSSEMSIKRLLAGESDIAASARALTPNEKSAGLSETPFAKDAIIVITNPTNHLTDLSTEQVRDIFSKKIKNANEIGGSDIALTVIVPAPDTASYQNFSTLVMKDRAISYDIAATQSTYVKSLTRRIKGSVSFINHAAINSEYERPVATKQVTVDGLETNNENYPYFSTFYLVTTGKPSAAAAKFIEYIFSNDFREIMVESEVIPLSAQ